MHAHIKAYIWQGVAIPQRTHLVVGCVQPKGSLPKKAVLWILNDPSDAKFLALDNQLQVILEAFRKISPIFDALEN